MNEKNELIITRLINASPMTVFKAWTEPESLKQWWGPKEFTAPFIEIDLRAGGRYLYAMEDADGKRYWSGGTFLEVVPPRRIVVLDHFADEKGNPVTAAHFGLDVNFPDETTATVTFEEENAKTRINIRYTLPESSVARKAIAKSGMHEGWNSSLDKFQALVEKPRAP
jgi:uncharacterized protein YndB with AHSA1/START domain